MIQQRPSVGDAFRWTRSLGRYMDPLMGKPGVVTAVPLGETL
jgi:hypothetical protein